MNIALVLLLLASQGASSGGDAYDKIIFDIRVALYVRKNCLDDAIDEGSIASLLSRAEAMGVDPFEGGKMGDRVAVADQAIARLVAESSDAGFCQLAPTRYAPLVRKR